MTTHGAGRRVERWCRRCVQLTIALVGAAGAFGCGGGGEGQGRGESQGGGSSARGSAKGLGRGMDEAAAVVRDAKGSARVTYQSNVRPIERDDFLGAVDAMSNDGSTFLFIDAGDDLRRLGEGDVLMVKGLFARMVLATEVNGDTLAILTGAAALGDIVRDGELSFDAPLKFSAASAASGARPPRPYWERALDLAVPLAHAQATEAQGPDRGKEMLDLYEKGKEYASSPVAKAIYEGWETSWHATPGNGRLDLDLQLTKDVGGFVAQIKGEGYLADFQLRSRLDVEQGVVEQVEMAAQRLNGVMNVNWTAAKESSGRMTERDRIKLPGAITIPLYQLLEGIPLFLEIGGAIIIQPAITGGKQYSHGAFRVTYDATQDFMVKEGNIDADGNVTGDIKLLETQGISATAPLGMVIALAAPRIELTLDPWKALGEISSAVSSQKIVKEAAEQADKYAQMLVKKVVGGPQADRLNEVLKNMSMGQMAGNAVKSTAAVNLQVILTSAMSASGMSAFTPCTRNDLKISLSISTMAQALGHAIGDAQKTLYEKKLEHIEPPGVKLCDL